MPAVETLEGTCPTLPFFTTVVDRTSRVNGNLVTEAFCAVRIDGRFSGSIKVPHGMVLVSSSGIAENVEIEAGVVVLEGFLQGVVLSHSSLHIQAGAEIKGTLQYACSVRIAPKAIVTAQLISKRSDLKVNLTSTYQRVA